MTTNRLTQFKLGLLSRYGVTLNAEDGWGELHLHGGIATLRSDFASLAEAAKAYGDSRAILYEMESIDKRFQPISFDLAYDSFLNLKRSTVSHFDLAMIPTSRQWAALLTNDLETFVFGTREFLAKI